MMVKMRFTNIPYVFLQNAYAREVMMVSMEAKFECCMVGDDSLIVWQVNERIVLEVVETETGKGYC